MGINPEYFQETPEEREIRKRATTGKRIRILVVVCIVAVGARIFIKNPEPPKPPDHSNKQVRVLPGMLENIPESARVHMNQQMLAKLQSAEQPKDIGLPAIKPQEAIAQYKPVEPPPGTIVSPESTMSFQYAQRAKRIIEPEIPPEEKTKTTVVAFASGGYLLVEQAVRVRNNVEIKVDASMIAGLPSHLVKSVKENAVGWQEPVPAGHVRLKPAKGITIVVEKSIGERITVPKA